MIHLVTPTSLQNLRFPMFQHYHADSRDRSRDSGDRSRANDFQWFSSILHTLVTDLVTPEIAPTLSVNSYFRPSFGLPTWNRQKQCHVTTETPRKSGHVGPDFISAEIPLTGRAPNLWREIQKFQRNLSPICNPIGRKRRRQSCHWMQGCPPQK